jgi:hypothetical protein
VEVIRKTQPIPVIEHQPYTSMTELWVEDICTDLLNQLK